MEDKQPNPPTFKQTLHKKRSLELEPQPLAKSRRQKYSKISADKEMEKESAKIELNDSPTSPEPIIQSSPSSSPEWDDLFYSSPLVINPPSSKLSPSNSASSKQKNPVDSYPPSPENSPTHVVLSASSSVANGRSSLKRSSEEAQEEPSLDFFLDNLHGSLDPYHDCESNNNNVNNSSSYVWNSSYENFTEKNNNTNNTQADDTEEEEEEEEEIVNTHPQKPSSEQNSSPMRFNSFRLTPPKKVVAPSKDVIDLRTPSPKPKGEHFNSNNRFAPISDKPAEYNIATEDENLEDVEWPEEVQQPANCPLKTSQEVPANQHKSRLRQSKLTLPPLSEPQFSESNNKKTNNTNNSQPYQNSRWRDDLPQPANRYSSFRDLLPYAELNRSNSRQNPPPSSFPFVDSHPTTSSQETPETAFNTDEELARHLQLMEQYGPNAERMIAQQRRHGTSLGMTGSRHPAPISRPQPSQDEEIARRIQEMEYNRAFGAASSLPSARGYDPMGMMHNLFARRRYGPPSHSGMNAPLQMRLAMTNRDFTDQDYEMLLQLDEQVEKKGASKAAIQHLPTRKIRDGETIENCVICLSEMEPGTEVKMLPCAHFFHSECIDQWLKQNKCCPIDKKDITEDH